MTKISNLLEDIHGYPHQGEAHDVIKNMRTYSCKSIHPFWNWVASQFITDVFAEMVAILHDQMICIAIVIYRVKLHKLSNLHWI